MCQCAGSSGYRPSIGDTTPGVLTLGGIISDSGRDIPINAARLLTNNAITFKLLPFS